MKKQKESCHQYRKRKANEKKEDKVLGDSMKKFVKNRTDTLSTESVEANTAGSICTGDGSATQSGDEAGELSSSFERMINIQPGPSTSNNEMHTESNESNTCVSEPIKHDPFTWPSVLNNSLIEDIVKSDLPPIPKRGISYPQHNGRCFNVSIFYATHVNGTPYEREWLIYSNSSDSVYCLFCALFNRNANQFCTVSRGYSDWKNIKRDVANHENTFKHHLAFKTWLDCHKRLQTMHTINAEQRKLLNIETDRWKEVIKRLVASVQFLA